MIFNCRFKYVRCVALVGGIAVSVLFPADQSLSFQDRAKSCFEKLLKKGKAYLEDEQFRRKAKRSAIEVGILAFLVGGAYYLGRYEAVSSCRSVLDSKNIKILVVPGQTIDNSCGACALINGSAIVDDKPVLQQYDENQIKRFYEHCQKKNGEMLDQEDLQKIIDAEDDLKNKNFCMFGGLDQDRFMSIEEIGEKIIKLLSGNIKALPVLVHVHGNHWIVDVLRKGENGDVVHTIADSMHWTKVSTLHASLIELIHSGRIAKEQKEQNENV